MKSSFIILSSTTYEAAAPVAALPDNLQVLNLYSEKGSLIILYMRDVDRIILPSTRLYKLIELVLKKLSGSVIVLGSHMLDSDYVNDEENEKLKLLFPYNIDVKPPKEEYRLKNWEAQLEEDMKFMKFQDNKTNIAEVLAANDLECDDLCSICQADSMVLSNYIEGIVISAISYHLMNNSNPEYRNGKLLISSKPTVCRVDQASFRTEILATIKWRKMLTYQRGGNRRLTISELRTKMKLKNQMCQIHLQQSLWILPGDVASFNPVVLSVRANLFVSVIAILYGFVTIHGMIFL